MSTVKISELTELTTPDGSEELIVNDGGASKKIDINNLYAGTGKLGIGTSSPAATLEVVGSTGIKTRTTSGATMEMIGTSTIGIIGTDTSHPVVMRVNNTEKMRIDTTGNVGIGTSSPSVKLDVDGDIKSNNSKVLTVADFSLSGGVLTITTT